MEPVDTRSDRGVASLKEEDIIAQTVEKRVMDVLARTSLYFLQGFFVGSILGHVADSRPRNIHQVADVRMAAPPVPYQTLVTYVAKKGLHCAIVLGTFAGAAEALDIVHGRKDPIVHYTLSGMLSGLVGGGVVSLVCNCRTPLAFRGLAAVRGGAAFGVAGLMVGLATEYFRRMKEASEHSAYVQRKDRRNFV